MLSAQILISKLKSQVLNVLDLDIFNYLVQLDFRPIRSILIHYWYNQTLLIQLADKQ